MPKIAVIKICLYEIIKLSKLLWRSKWHHRRIMLIFAAQHTKTHIIAQVYDCERFIHMNYFPAVGYIYF